MSKRLRLSGRLKGRERGQELVEFALVIPVVMLVFIGILEFSMLMFSFNTISSAAREGARYASVFPTDTVGIEEAARRLTSGLDEDALTITITPIDTGSPAVTVEVDYDHPLATGMFLAALGVSDSVYPIHAASTMQTE